MSQEEAFIASTWTGETPDPNAARIEHRQVDSRAVPTHSPYSPYKVNGGDPLPDPYVDAGLNRQDREALRSRSAMAGAVCY
ncbi:hypothetical protein AcW2_006982 [Taiwanofungus camphoratus]|nr:hypothetical protein AcW2_006982 [Antrodia cinnamomea]